RESMKKGGILPLVPPSNEQGRNLIVVDDLLNCDFLDRHTSAITIPKQLGYDLQLVAQNSLMCALEDTRATLLQLFIRGNPFRGKAGLNAIAQNFYQKLLQSGLVQGLFIYGSPYVIDWFLAQLPSELPWIFSYGQMPMAQAIACETLFNLSRISHAKADTFL
ncbi:MAG: beta-glucosidase, partial [Microcystaceae cyanobacterium]